MIIPHNLLIYHKFLLHDLSVHILLQNPHTLRKIFYITLFYKQILFLFF